MDTRETGMIAQRFVTAAFYGDFSKLSEEDRAAARIFFTKYEGISTGVNDSRLIIATCLISKKRERCLKVGLHPA